MCSILTPYKARYESDWFEGTADAVQQNFTFIKQDHPDQVLILVRVITSTPWIMTPMITFHRDHPGRPDHGESSEVPIEEASRFGIVSRGRQLPGHVLRRKAQASALRTWPTWVCISSTANVLDRALWEDHPASTILPRFRQGHHPAACCDQGRRIFAFPYTGYWMDVGTRAILLAGAHGPALARSAVCQTVRPQLGHSHPHRGTPASAACRRHRRDLCQHACPTAVVIEEGATVESSVLSPGVIVRAGAVVRESDPR
ncbi:MAG: hypothetical protein MZV64_62900 [Ignavibacteriales bacterium]|nr:hypothetical protein [Ignavibacteriales bacterium]